MMGLISQAFETRAARFPASSIANPQAWLLGLLGQANTNSGATVDHNTAYGLPAFATCVKIISEDFAKTPIDMYRRQGEGKRKATERPEHYLVHDAPNEEMTANEWKSVVATHVVTWGNHYSRIEWDGMGYASQLWPLDPGYMKVEAPAGRRYYVYEKPGEPKVTYNAEEILHIMGFTLDGLIGVDMISIAREALGLGLTLQEFAARFFANGAQPTGILTHDRTLSDEAQKRLKADFQDVYARIDQKHRVFVFEEGMKYTQISMPNDNAQFIESRNLSLRDLGALWRIPPYKLGYTESGASFASITQQALDYYRDTQMPMQVRTEQKMTQRLLTRKEARKFFFEFNSDILLRGDTQARYEAHSKGIQNGFLTINEARARENMNPAPPEIGDVFRIQQNMDTAGTEPAGKSTDKNQNKNDLNDDKPQENNDNQDNLRNFSEALQPIFSDLEARLNRREMQDIGLKAGKFQKSGDVTGFNEWFKGWLTDHRSWLKSTMGPAYEVRAGIAGSGADLASAIDDRIEELTAKVQESMALDGLDGVVDYFTSKG